VIIGDFVFLAMAMVNESQTERLLLSLVSSASLLNLIRCHQSELFDSLAVEKYVS